MGEGEPTTARQITGDDIIAEVLRNAEQGVFKIRYTALLPSIYHVYLHPSDYDTVKPVLTALAAEARAALIQRLEQLNRETKPGAIVRTQVSIQESASSTRSWTRIGQSSSTLMPKTSSVGVIWRSIPTRVRRTTGFRRRRYDTSRYETVSIWRYVFAPDNHI